MISSNFKEHLEHVLGCPISKVNALSGGDISKAFCIHTATQRFFIKLNRGAIALEMFLAEKEGLESIGLTKTIKVPSVLSCTQFEGTSYLLLEHIEPKSPTFKDYEALGQQLADFHSFDAGDTFGWKQNNFIGSLPQSNKNHPDWAQFYVHERLLPQLKMAKEKRLLISSEIPSESKLLKGCERFFTKVKPALLHGDLWGGNYLINAEGTPYLIDPAVYYGHREVDIAMTKLFGGFSSSFYNAYSEHFNAEPFEEERKDIYQLYYLLVHLNLFGSSYYRSVKGLLSRCFK